MNKVHHKMKQIEVSLWGEGEGIKYGGGARGTASSNKLKENLKRIDIIRVVYL